MSNQLSAFLDKDKLSYGAGRLFGGPALQALLDAHAPLDLTDRSWLPEIGHASDLGRTQGITITKDISKIDLTTADDGERPADRGLQSLMWRVTANLADAGIVKLAEVTQGMTIERYTNGNLKRIAMTDDVFELDSERYTPILFRLYRRGVLSTRPMDNILFFQMAPNQDSVESSFTSGDQRIYAIELLAYKSLSFTMYDPDTGDHIPLHGTTFMYGSTES